MKENQIETRRVFCPRCESSEVDRWFIGMTDANDPDDDGTDFVDHFICRNFDCRHEFGSQRLSVEKAEE